MKNYEIPVDVLLGDYRLKIREIMNARDWGIKDLVPRTYMTPSRLLNFLEGKDISTEQLKWLQVFIKETDPQAGALKLK